MGVAAGQSFPSTLTGDDSLRRRPQKRIAEPLTKMGAIVNGQGDSCLPPITVRGGKLKGINHFPSTPSAQVKSALLLAGLYAEGTTTVLENEQTRDHTERMLPSFGAKVKLEGNAVSVAGGQSLRAIDFAVPGDVSSAAFFLVAAAILPGSAVRIRRVGVNHTRTGLLEVLAQMGAKVEVSNEGVAGGEPVADILVESRPLQGVEIGGALIPRLIDEVPIVTVAACFAQGITEIRDAPQLRQKESDRIETIALELGKMGARIEPLPDGLRVYGGTKLVGARCESHGDHRIAMSLAIAALAAEGSTEIEDTECISTSFPEFPKLLEAL
jgi:3-phosphoshikimate 1-carboxyvinyltransferase